MKSFNMPPRLPSVLTTSLLLLLACPTAVLSEVVFSNPIAGRTFTADTQVEITWRDDGSEPVTTTAGTFTLELCVGSNADIFPIYAIPLAATTFGTAAGRATAIIPSNIGANSQKYFFQMTWTTNAGTVKNYSDRFTMQGMVGAFSAQMITANQAGDTDRPEAVHPNVVRQEGDFAVPYTEQNGPIRYAPMQPRPGTAIIGTNKKPLHPTSAYTIYTTKGGAPLAGTTVTAPRTYALTTVENDASPAPMPNEDPMQRYLNRWKD